MAYIPLTWTNLVNVDTFPNANDLRKISGVPNVYDAGAVSAEQIASAIADAGIRFSIQNGAAGGEGVGLTADNPDQDWQTIDYCLMQWADGLPSIAVYENGTMMWSADLVIYSQYQISVNALGQIEFWETEFNTLLYTSLTAPSFPLFAKGSIDIYGTRITGAQINTLVAAYVDHLMMMGVH